MAKGYQPTGILKRAGFEQAELEEWLTAAKTELRAGKGKVQEWTSEAESAKKLFDGYGLTTLQAIEEIVFALEALDPVTHGQDIVPPVTHATFG